MLNFILRRTLIIIPMIILISMISFLIITLPPGSYIDSYLANLQQMGGEVEQSRADTIKERYGLNDPIYLQYWKWVKGFPRGDFGMAFSEERPVINIIQERIGYTILISSLTLLFTWVLSIPIGIYSAVKQYSFGDYAFTFFGFLGVSIPNFLLAIIIMFVGLRFFGINLSGLMPVQYMGEPWGLSKILAVLQRIWVPVVVVGTAGMAGLIRIMRAEMLDQLRQPYIQMARSKGVDEIKVIIKYAARIAVNPLISTIGWLLPQIISGGTIAGIVLGLPTLGPKLYDALKIQDMYLAGTIIFFNIVLILIGTLLSDILLALVDPRIRYD
ncbi:peptide/nickel transport system permease protein [Halanaerobium saccharolyticum]|uniref:Peptide/nickel transport system permease protein n=1 Tax=Halanaerobium saccharolyticum TaxID=43595 RepID=A0A4R6LTU5_9FIRM|nr:ABC transporter permease [Halanaerobium saccharolyticum]TDO92072.1 peptide/nickel transport system permease protein [Halanaerobium saccharolyticum]